jgi:hypothetical protein
MIDEFMNLSRIVIAAALSACAGAVASAQKPASKPDQKAEAAAAQAQQQEYSTVVRLADTAMSGQAGPADFPVQFSNDFLRAQGGRVWIPFTLTFDPAKPPPAALTFYVRVAPRGMTTPPPPTAGEKPNDKNKKDNKKDAKGGAPPAAPNYPYEDIAVLDLKPAPAGQPQRLVRGLGVPAGSYDAYIVLHERGAAAGAPAKTTVLKQPLDVPNYTAGEFATSSVILAQRVEQLPAPLPVDQQAEHPYTFGTAEIIVSPDHKFKKTDELIVLVQIYNPILTPDKKFALETSYTFYRQESGAEKRFNSTEPQALTPETSTAVFDPSGAGPSVQAGQGIPLQSFPEGTYRLEIKITDKQAKPEQPKVITQSVSFTVTP